MSETNGLKNFVERYTGNTPAIYVNNVRTTLEDSRGYYSIKCLSTGCVLSSITSTAWENSSAIDSGSTWAKGAIFVSKMDKIILSSKGQFEVRLFR